MNERHITHIEDVRRDYTEQEIMEKGKTIAKLMADSARLESERKLAADSFKNQIAAVDDQINELGKHIRQGYETIPTPCDVVLNRPTPGMKSYISQKTLAIIRTAPMTDQERQRSFFEDYNDGQPDRSADLDEDGHELPGKE